MKSQNQTILFNSCPAGLTRWVEVATHSEHNHLPLVASAAVKIYIHIRLSSNEFSNLVKLITCCLSIDVIY
jgi:hypothetical protein